MPLLCCERLCTVWLSEPLVSPHHESAEALYRHGRARPVLVPVARRIVLVDVLPHPLLHAGHLYGLVLLPGSH